MVSRGSNDWTRRVDIANSATDFTCLDVGLPCNSRPPAAVSYRKDSKKFRINWIRLIMKLKMSTIGLRFRFRVASVRHYMRLSRMHRRTARRRDRLRACGSGGRRGAARLGQGPQELELGEGLAVGRFFAPSVRGSAKHFTPATESRSGADRR